MQLSSSLGGRAAATPRVSVAMPTEKEPAFAAKVRRALCSAPGLLLCTTALFFLAGGIGAGIGIERATDPCRDAVWVFRDAAQSCLSTDEDGMVAAGDESQCDNECELKTHRVHRALGRVADPSGRKLSSWYTSSAGEQPAGWGSRCLVCSSPPPPPPYYLEGGGAVSGYSGGAVSGNNQGLGGGYGGGPVR
jgi:hypothetical protein